MNTIKLNTLGDKVIVRKAAENGGNAGGDTGGSGGGNASGGSGMRYIDMRNADPGLLNAMLVASSLAGFNQSGEFIVASAIMLERGMQGVDLDISNNATAIAVPWDEELRLPIISIRVSDFILANISEDKIKFLTKDEFYNPATYA